MVLSNPYTTSSGGALCSVRFFFTSFMVIGFGIHTFIEQMNLWVAVRFTSLSLLISRTINSLTTLYEDQNNLLGD